jgi:hypothetical protein
VVLRPQAAQVPLGSIAFLDEAAMKNDCGKGFTGQGKKNELKEGVIFLKMLRNIMIRCIIIYVRTTTTPTKESE